MPVQKTPRELTSCEKQRSGRQRTATDEPHRSHVDKLFREKRRITQEEDTTKCGISRERVQAVITDLRYRKIGA